MFAVRPARLVSLLSFLAVSLALPAAAQSVGSNKKTVNTAPYPLGNPVIRHMYTADAAPHVMPDGRVWMVTSVDSEDGGGYETMHEYHAFSSADMVDWIDHGQVLHIDDVRVPGSPPADKYALWAPDMIYRNGKYYLYYPVRILHSDQQKPDGGRVVTAYLGVAVSDHPGRRFTVVNPRIEGTRGIDPAVFIDDDGEAYLYWGSHMAARLADTMTELADEPVQLEVGTDRFMEAVWMNKRDGRYYLSYHTKYDWKVRITAENAEDPDRARSELAWSVGDSPMGPFTYGGTLNYELGVNVANGPRHPGGDFVPWRLTQSNHGGIVEFHGREYLFYHTSALSSWRQDAFAAEGTWTQRSVCIDRIDYTADGRIIPVRQTIEGVEPVEIDQPFRIDLPIGEAAEVTGARREGDGLRVLGGPAVVRFANVDLGSGYYFFGAARSGSGVKARIEVRLGSPGGPLAGTVRFGRANDGLGETFLRAASGRHDICLVIAQDETDTQTLFSDFHFSAGAPTQLDP